MTGRGDPGGGPGRSCRDGERDEHEEVARAGLGAEGQGERRGHVGPWGGHGQVAGESGVPLSRVSRRLPTSAPRLQTPVTGMF